MQTLDIGHGGWVAFKDEEMHVFVRFADQAAGARLVAVDLFLPAPPGRGVIDPTVLRRVPIAGIEAWVNSPELADDVRAHLPVRGVSLRAAAAYTGTTFGSTRAFDKAATEVLATSAALDKGVPAPLPKPRRPKAEVDATLTKPEGARYGDDFYRAVAGVYEALTRVTNSPAVVIADANGVPVTTAHRWIKEARKRGFLPPGHKGKRG